MIEAILVFAAVAILSALGIVGPSLDPQQVLVAGAGITILGLLEGVPTGVWYHVALYRTLRVRGPLPERWWVHPVALHPSLRPEERPGVLRWFVAGGIGFVLVVIGCGTVILGVLLQWLAVRG